ncbi:proteasome subunit beta [Striga asiatica]|uniref:Proteasome subunit beta n=1 Tax=Striga asiatica TaxID=4170 RepID=A0A5A7RKR0_STRAF|nr:proteasome subunit beta [Striga asiatica]
MNQHCSSSADVTFNPWDSKVEKGMTILGFVLKEGIVIAADHRSRCNFAKKEYYSSVGILIAVWNESERGLYKVNGDGVITKDDILATGSGSPVTILVKGLECLYTKLLKLPKRFTTSEVRASKSSLRRIWKNIKASSLVSPGPRLLEKDGVAVARRLCSFAWFDGFLVTPKCCKGVDNQKKSRTWNFLKSSIEKFSSVAGWP